MWSWAVSFFIHFLGLFSIQLCSWWEACIWHAVVDIHAGRKVVAWWKCACRQLFLICVFSEAFGAQMWYLQRRIFATQGGNEGLLGLSELGCFLADVSLSELGNIISATVVLVINLFGFALTKFLLHRSLSIGWVSLVWLFGDSLSLLFLR